MATRTWYFAAILGLAVAGGVTALVLSRRPRTPPVASIAPSPAPPADCLMPGPPPVTPNGETASIDEMKLGHDNLQHFVDQLEAYQACRNAQIDRAAASVTAAQKQIWLQDGNDAIDEANAIASRFSAQRRVFNAKNNIQ